MTFALVSLLVACGSSAPKAPPAPAESPWVSAVGTWYCGSEPIPATAPNSAAGSRDFIVKLTPGEDAFTGLYAIQEGPRKYIGAFTRFVATGDRAATLHAENSQRQKGDAKLAFSPDYKTLTVEWQVATHAAVTTTSLALAADPSVCAAKGLLK